MQMAMPIRDRVQFFLWVRDWHCALKNDAKKLSCENITTKAVTCRLWLLSSLGGEQA
jgi:hypothetical protein